MPKETNKGPYTGKWYADRNERRKQRYHSDPEYRVKANKDARDGYRKARGPENVRDPIDPRPNLHMLQPGPTCAGKLRTLKDHPGAGPVMTFTRKEIGEVFGRPGKQLQVWGLDGRIPLPMLSARCESTERSWSDVYTVPEVRAMVEALGPYLAEVVYFRIDNKEAVEACRKAVAAARKKTVAA